MLLTYSITKAKRMLCDVAQFDQWWRISLSTRVQTMQNHIRFVFPTIPKITTLIFVLTTENTNSDLKVHALHYANELLVRVRLSFQKLLQTRLICRNNTKNVWETSNDTYSISVRVHTTINHILICFLPQYQRQRKCFSSERELKNALCDTLTWAAWYGL